MNTLRHYTLLDKLCFSIDQVVRTMAGTTHGTNKPYPADQVEEAELSDAERKHAAALMRINHAGEVSAQALYHAQAIFSREATVNQKMHQAALEEGDHLLWCQKRLEELGSHPSYLNPLWYGGSFCIGLAAGMIGDQWSLGFVAETEQQVIRHLAHHLESLPQKDKRSYAILNQMGEDEAHHRNEALTSGAKELPKFIRKAMSLTSKVMVKTAYYL